MRMLPILGVILFSLPVSGQSTNELRQTAVESARAGRWSEAEKAMRAVIGREPDDAESLVFLGTILDALARPSESRPLFERALRQPNLTAPLLKNAAVHYRRAGDTATSAKLLSRASVLAPEDTSVRLELARIAVESGDGRAALKELMKLPPEVRRAPPTLFLEAEALKLSGMKREADTKLGELERMGESDPAISYSLGVVYARTLDYEKAEAQFSRTLRFRPNDPDLLYNLGLAAAKLGHWERARAAFESSLRLRPADPNALFHLGQVHAAQGHHDKACARLVEAANLSPGSPEVWLSLARALEGARLFGDAVAAYTKYLQAIPGDASVRRDRGLAHAIAGSRDLALEDLEASVLQAPSDPLAHYYLGLIHEAGDPETAMRDVTRALELKPGFPSASVLQARLFLNSGDVAEAQRVLEQATKHTPDGAEVLHQLGVVYLSLSRPADAEAVLKKASQIDPHSAPVHFSLGRAEIELGKTDQGAKTLTLAQELRAREPQTSQNPGAIDLLKLPAAERSRAMIGSLRRTVDGKPGDERARLRLATALLDASRSEEARTEFDRLLSLPPTAATCLEAGKRLVRGAVPDLAFRFFSCADAGQAISVAGKGIALGQMGRAEEGLRILADFAKGKDEPRIQLVRALLLERTGRLKEAGTALASIDAEGNIPTDMALEAARILTASGNEGRALELLARERSNSPEEAVARGYLLQRAGRVDEAQKLLIELQRENPGWGRPFVVEAFSWRRLKETGRAASALEAAVALGEENALEIADALSEARRAEYVFSARR